MTDFLAPVVAHWRDQVPYLARYYSMPLIGPSGVLDMDYWEFTWAAEAAMRMQQEEQT